MSGRQEQKFSGAQRQRDGLIVTVTNERHTRTLVRRETPVLVGLRDIVRQIEAWPGAWRVTSISTPQTIYRDLQGSRGNAPNQRRDGLGGFTTDPPETHTMMPERPLLAQIGRLDLLA